MSTHTHNFNRNDLLLIVLKWNVDIETNETKKKRSEFKHFSFRMDLFARPKERKEYLK